MSDPDHDRYSIPDFVEKTAQKDKGQGVFELERSRMLEVNLDGMVWTKAGSMIAYRGSIRFEREGMLEHGLGTFLKKTFSGEGARLTKATGKGKVYLSDAGKNVSVLRLVEEAIVVNGNDVLAFEPSLKFDITMMRRIASLLAGGLFNVRFQGTGLLAITSHFEPLTLKVTRDHPVYTDANATIAWSGSLSPELKTDVTFKTFLGRGSGESLQMAFHGEGFVVVQPYEEVYLQQGSG